MTRQVALGAIVAFALTVLVLSVWTPSAPVVTAPPPAPAPPTPSVERVDKMPAVRELSPALRDAIFLRAAAVEKRDAGATP